MIKRDGNDIRLCVSAVQSLMEHSAVKSLLMLARMCVIKNMVR